MAKLNSTQARKKRHIRVRARISGSSDKPRLCVFRSLKNIYAQVVDDSAGRTLAAAGSTDAELAEKTAGKNKKDNADLVGTLIAQRASKAGVKKIVFDRG